MSDEEEVLELGARRRPAGMRILLVLVLVAAAAGYLVARNGGGGSRDHAGPTPRPPASTAPSPTAESSTAIPNPPIRPPWPRRDAACGGTTFLPLVSAHALDRRTGIRVLVGDRLTTVDVDTGEVQPAAGLPPGEFASQVVDTSSGTYALLRRCDQNIDSPARLVRLDRTGTVHTVARGKYDYLLSGGNHVWAEHWNDVNDRVSLEPLDGGRTVRMPAAFGPVGAYGNLIVGTVNQPSADPDSPFTIRVIDPTSGDVRLNLGPARSIALSGGSIVWTTPGCTACRVHVHDLMSGRDTVTRRPVARVASAWAAVVSPDRRAAAFVRQRAKPVRYDMEHPGNPNEIVIVDLASGATHTVPDLALWSKSSPGLAFSADSRWLVISLDEGSGVSLLVWKPGLREPLQSPAQLTAKVAYSPTVKTV
jgi:hypothetical protein